MILSAAHANGGGCGANQGAPEEANQPPSPANNGALPHADSPVLTVHATPQSPPPSTPRTLHTDKRYLPWAA